MLKLKVKKSEVELATKGSKSKLMAEMAIGAVALADALSKGNAAERAALIYAMSDSLKCVSKLREEAFQSDNDANKCIVEAGEHFEYMGLEWIALDNVDGGILAIMAGSWNGKEYRFDEDGKNNYAKSSLRKLLLDELLPVLGEEDLLPHTVDLTADNGDTRYGTVTDKVFILSCGEYRKYRKYIAVPEAYMWTCTPWWIDEEGYGNYVRFVSPSGALSHNFANVTYGVAPACVFNPKILQSR